MTDDHLISTSEAAERLGVSAVTVARWVRQGRLEPAETLPYGRGVHRFDPAVVDAHRRGAEAPARAAALREAADAWDEHPENVHGFSEVFDVAEWLRERADEVEAGRV